MEKAGCPSCRPTNNSVKAVISEKLRTYKYNVIIHNGCLQCFDAVGLVAGRASGLQNIEWLGAGAVICLGRGADLHMVRLMPLPPTVSCFSVIQLGFTFLLLAYPGSPGQRAIKWMLLLLIIHTGIRE